MSIGLESLTVKRQTYKFIWGALFAAAVFVGSLCATVPVVAQTFPQTILVSQLTRGLPLAPVPGALASTRVQWHLENLGDIALDVRHIVEAAPTLKLEVVFDGELRTFALARSWHGHLSDDPGAHVTLTHYQNRLSLTIDSPKYGVIAVRDSTVNPVDNTIQGIASIRDIDRVPFVKDDPNSFEEMVQISRGKTAEALLAASTAAATGRALAIEQKNAANAVAFANAEVVAARRGRDDLAIKAALGRLRDAQLAAEQLALRIATNVVELGNAKTQLAVAQVAEADMNQIQVEAARRRNDWNAKTGEKGPTLIAPNAKRMQIVRDSVHSGNAAAKATLTAAGPAIVKATAFGFSASCADPVGEIDVAVVVSNRAWGAALNTATAQGSQSQAFVAAQNLTGDITHALDMANTALKRSAVSHPVYDIGFRLIRINTNANANATATVVADGMGSTEPYGEWLRYSNTGAQGPTYRTAMKAAAQSGLFVTSSQASATNMPDVIVAVIIGDSSLATMRGVATIGDPDLQLTAAPPYVVVKIAALNAPETHAMAHELGHILGAGHDAVSATSGDSSTAGFKSWARGQVNMTNSSLNITNRETLMGLSACAQPNPSSAYSCRRVPFYSNQQVQYPYYGGVSLGSAAADNAAIMRQTRNMTARVACASPASGVWLKKPPSLPTVPISVNSLLKPLPWESQSLWRRTNAEPGGTVPPNTYQHQNVPAGLAASYFVSAFVHNAWTTPKVGVLWVWRAKKPAAGGRWLSPIFSDLQRLNPTGSTPLCSNKFSALSSGAWSLEVPCTSVPFQTEDDPLFIRWVPNIGNALGSYLPPIITPLVDITKSPDALSLWRSMTIIPLDVGEVSAPQIVVLRKSTSGPRTLVLSVKPAPNQGSFYGLISAVKTVEIAAQNVIAMCVGATNVSCVLSQPSTGVQSFEILPGGAELTLILPTAQPASDVEVPVKITFQRAPNIQDLSLPGPDLPPTDVMIRVIEFESGQLLGGASFVVQAKRQ